MDASSLSGLPPGLPREEAGVFRPACQDLFSGAAPCSSLKLAAGQDTPPAALAQSAPGSGHTLSLPCTPQGVRGAASPPWCPLVLS